MPVSSKQRELLMMLRHAVWSGQLCVVNLHSRATGAETPTLCISSFPTSEVVSEEEHLVLCPIGVLLDPEQLASQLEVPSSMVQTVISTFTAQLRAVNLIDFPTPPEEGPSSVSSSPPSA